MEISNSENQPIIREDLGLYISSETKTEIENITVTATVGILDKRRGGRSYTQSGDLAVAKTEKGPFYYGVFDGMGGHSNDSKSARAAAKEIALAYNRGVATNVIPNTEDAIALITEGFNNAQKEVVELNGGTTVALVVPTKETDGKITNVIAWSGDSQVYLTRNGVTTLLTPTDNLISKYLLNDESRLEWDKKYLNCTTYTEFKDLMENIKGDLSPEAFDEALIIILYKDLVNEYDYSSAWNMMQSLTSGLGSTSYDPELHIKKVDVNNGDVITICSDGLDPITLNEKDKIVQNSITQHNVVEGLLSQVDKVDGIRSKSDDCAVVSICFRING